MCFLFKRMTAYDSRISDWISDVGSSVLAESMRVIGDALRVVARGGRDHALGARRLVELEQGIERAAFLVGRGELEILELEIDRGAGHFRKRLADQLRRSHDGIGNPPVRRANVLDLNGEMGRESCRERV